MELLLDKFDISYFSFIFRSMSTCTSFGRALGKNKLNSLIQPSTFPSLILVSNTEYRRCEVYLENQFKVFCRQWKPCFLIHKS